MVADLLQYLPAGQQDEANLRTTLRSAQLQQTLQRLTAIMNSDQYGSLVQSLGLRNTGDLGLTGFLASIDEQAKKELQEEEKKK